MSARGTVVVTREWVRASQDQTWSAIIPCDLPAYFTGMKPLVPAIASVSDQTGDWDAAGQSRTIHLADGSHVAETIDQADRPGTFRYTVGPFSGPLNKLVENVSGEFVFEPLGGGTSIKWTYSWHPRPGMKPLVVLLAKVWSAYSKRVLADLARAAQPSK